VLAALCACACAGSPRARAHELGPAHDSRFVEHERAAASPLPEPARSGDAAAIKTTGLGESARAAALAMVRALLESDAAALQLLFAEQVVFGLEGTGRPRAELVERCMEETRALAYEPHHRTDRVVDVNAIEVRRADHYHNQVPLPPGIRPDDLLVTLPPRQLEPETRPRVPCLSSVYVRVGRQTHIVGLTR